MAFQLLEDYIQKQLNPAERCRTAVLGTLLEGRGTLRSSRVVAVVSGQSETSECALFIYKFLGTKPTIHSVYSLDGVYFINDAFSVTILNATERAECLIKEPDSIQAVKFCISTNDSLTFLFEADQPFLFLLKEINGGVRAGFGKHHTDVSWLDTYAGKVLKRTSFARPHAATITPETGALIDLGDDVIASARASASASDPPSASRASTFYSTNPFAPDVVAAAAADTNVTTGSVASSDSQTDMFDSPNFWCPSPSLSERTVDTDLSSPRGASPVNIPSSGDRSTASFSETTAAGSPGSVDSALVLRDNGQANNTLTVTDGKKGGKKDFFDAAMAVGKSPMTIMKRAGRLANSPLLSRKQATQASTSKTGSAAGMPTYSRHSFLGMKMANREDQFTYKQGFRVFCGTWNVNGQYPKEGLQPWLGLDADAPDMYSIGFQELDLSAEALLLNDSSREDEWIRAIQVGLNQRGGARYQKIKHIRLVGMLLVVYVRDKHVEFVQDVEAQMAGTGLMGMMGNKGGVAVRFQFHNTYMCFVNSHLAAHAEEVEKRNQDYAEITSRLEFSDGKTIMDHNTIFWMGDLNYRLIGNDSIDDLMIRELASGGHIDELKKLDQLHEERARGNVFNGFSEGEITFRPTYKFDPGTDNWDSSEKNRPPAWCDRILWCGSDVEQLGYRGHPQLMLSDHKPVSAIFKVPISVIDVEKHRQVFEEVSREMDRLENDSIPVASLATNELIFNDVRYREEQSRLLEISNVGQVPMQFSFVPKPQEPSYCRPWLWIKPAVGFVYPNKSVKISMTMFVDTESVAGLTSGQEKLEDILIFHLEGGKDYFVSISGRFIKTCFGMGLHALMAQDLHVREVPVADLLGGVSDQPKSTAHAMHRRIQIPKELVFLVQYITDHGMDSENLFLESGTRHDFLQLSEYLDTGVGSYSGPVNTAAEAMLLFLEALPEPVIPFQHYQRCLEASNQYLLCRQVLSKITPLNQRVFMYMIKFLKDLIARTDRNKLEPKLLATLFGNVLIRAPKAIATKLASSKRSQSSASKKASAFLYHFLVER
eukprot:scpid22968/ scgid22172/ Inositol polyphosphate 5-phosphatase OCRL-1; Lowe oculocerebrorenal syndrome protein